MDELPYSLEVEVPASGKFFPLELFSHLDRVRKFGKTRDVSFREESARKQSANGVPADWNQVRRQG